MERFSCHQATGKNSTRRRTFDGNLGKVLHLTAEGQPVARQPLRRRGGVAAQFWTIGHRNELGLAFAPDGRLWESEMGPEGGDEINLIEAGKNYGYPMASNGSHYDGRDIPDHGPATNSPRPNYCGPRRSRPAG